MKEKVAEIKEKCISCDTETNVNQNTHIDARHHYVEGACQLCTNCYDSVCSPKR